MKLEKLLQLINSKTDRRTQLAQRAQTTESMEEFRGLESEIATLDEEITELRSLYDSLSGATNEDWQQNDAGQRSATNGVVGGFNPIATYSTGAANENRGEEDMFSSLEYRQAFRNYVVNGTPIPEKFKHEQRADQLTTVGDIGAVIPTTILNQVIEDMTVEGKILSRVTQTSYQGGISIPISEVMPEATWLADENTVSDEQKAKMDAKITFGYHVLEAKVAIGLLTATVSLPVFEATVVKQLKKAMIKAIESAIVKGDGSGKPLGFINVEGLPEENVIKFTNADIETVSKWAEVEAAIPEEVEDEVIYVMAKPTWEKHLNGMVDKNGQKIGLGKINEKGQKILNGREVLTVDKFPSFLKAENEAVFGAVINLSQYLLNSNLSMYYKKYWNEDKNKWIHKSLMIVDGKMAMGKDSTHKMVGAQGLILLKKATE
ncbi:phage major capsid protein [Clostridium perfringens]|uniref:phage major capsid protein n=1 Tax=Clostridium perfringens TaxID=1502 RepID=UPI0018E4AE5F|nr:phage major capsid protein [Clostridium perfringens]MBI5993959.1 phage major capsid protein [Clostridium perfringens]MDM0661793.1 phage major capsid protein [Clostridium perfringens]